MGLHHKSYSFTQHGAIIAATILGSPQEVEVSLLVVRAFVKLRQWIASQKEQSDKLNELNRNVTGNDEAVRQWVTAGIQLVIHGSLNRPDNPGGIRSAELRKIT
jgi:hypothetical protein